MPNFETSYAGLSLKNPIVAGASDLTKNVDTIKKLEEAGVAALVTGSLFEEEVLLEKYKFEEDLTKYNYKYAEMTDVFPSLEHAGPEEHLMWVRKTKEAVSIPVIGSLNALHDDIWVDYAKKMEQTGVDALELNLYQFPTDFSLNGNDLETKQLEQLKQVLKAVSIPVTVKLSPFYTNHINFISQLDKAGIHGFVLFNRFFQPDIDINEEKNTFPFHLSTREDARLPLRYTGLLHGEIKGDICASTGVYEGEDVVKMLLAGANCVQTVSALYKNKISSVSTMLKSLGDWMDKKGYASIKDFKGKLSRKESKDPNVYTRSQYVKLLLHPEVIIKNFPVL